MQEKEIPVLSLPVACNGNLANHVERGYISWFQKPFPFPVFKPLLTLFVYCISQAKLPRSETPSEDASEGLHRTYRGPDFPVLSLIQLQPTLWRPCPKANRPNENSHASAYTSQYVPSDRSAHRPKLSIDVQNYFWQQRSARESLHGSLLHSHPYSFIVDKYHSNWLLQLVDRMVRKCFILVLQGCKLPIAHICYPQRYLKCSKRYYNPNTAAQVNVCLKSHRHLRTGC